VSSVADCGLAHCPVPHPDEVDLRSLRTAVWDAGTLRHRGHKTNHPDPAALVPGVGATRFAPLPGVEHVYLAGKRLPALLESAFHDVVPGWARLPVAVLAQWRESQVRLEVPVRLIDLRDDELDRLGLGRNQLVATTPTHYACTRAWAQHLHNRRVGGQQTHGLVWHSRQLELQTHAMTDRPAVRELLEAHPAEVAVVWSPPADQPLLQPTGIGLGPLDQGDGERYITDLAALLDIVVQP
jgi:hypothetical protein